MSITHGDGNESVAIPMDVLQHSEVDWRVPNAEDPELEQETQLRRNAAVLALLLDEVLGERDLLHAASRARVTISRTSLLRSPFAATRAIASRAALR